MELRTDIIPVVANAIVPTPKVISHPLAIVPTPGVSSQPLTLTLACFVVESAWMVGGLSKHT